MSAMFGRSSRRLARRARPARRAVTARLRRIPVPRRARVLLSGALLRRPWRTVVPLDKLLLGPQNARRHTAAEFAAATGDLLWPSTPVTEGPHVELLRLAAGRELTDADILASPYGRMARQAIRAHGAYFDATDDAGVVAVARRFLAGDPGDRPEPLLVAPIRGSDCYQLLDGHHRAARAAVGGARTVEVTAKWAPVTTPLQDLLTEMTWLDGDRQLYQPLPGAELRSGWPTVRRCTDRLDKLTEFLGEHGIDPPATYLDVASCYGWFVHRLGELGYDAEGMERDPLARPLGRAAYGLDPARVHIGDCVDLLRATDRRRDVVSCFSLLHHFVLGRAKADHTELLRLLDGVTGRVLFLDTGQEHEAWFRTSLRGWDPERIAAELAEHTTFDKIVDLGPDADAVPPHADNYGRHLFACLRTTR